MAALLGRQVEIGIGDPDGRRIAFQLFKGHRNRHGGGSRRGRMSGHDEGERGKAQRGGGGKAQGKGAESGGAEDGHGRYPSDQLLAWFKPALTGCQKDCRGRANFKKYLYF